MNVDVIGDPCPRAGPAIGGAMIASWGIGTAYAAQTGVYLLSLIPLIGLKFRRW